MNAEVVLTVNHYHEFCGQSLQFDLRENRAFTLKLKVVKRPMTAQWSQEDYLAAGANLAHTHTQTTVQ